MNRKQALERLNDNISIDNGCLTELMKDCIFSLNKEITQSSPDVFFDTLKSFISSYEHRKERLKEYEVVKSWIENMGD